MKRPVLLFVFAFAAATTAQAAATPSPSAQPGALELGSIPLARFQFADLVGDRLQANVEQWLLVAPQANPGLLEMFRLRDRQPVPQLVPWAGEFVGKYLISAVQALRMSEDPRLAIQVSNVVAGFIRTQADDGYLGPFPRDIRLLRNWDLWGHYHAILALALWHERTGDPAALAAARRAADLACATYLDTGRRVLDAGDPEMNMAILTGLGLLHRLTGEPRYLRLVREVEKDWERAGDYLRAGLDGREFFQSPRPRWESLHSLQGLVELWRITGGSKYRDAFIHHWRSIRRWDRRNTGGFSSGEQATGNPYAPTAIETCCTVAWMALTLDYLRLTGDPLAVDDLELALLNGGLGAQHPSGRWWTYNTPMDGTREASAHTIVFQSRAGTPELNCCSVNAPRVLGALSEWAVMTHADHLLLHWHGPGRVSLSLPAQGHLTLACTSDYPVGTNATWTIERLTQPRDLTLAFRIPGWCTSATLQVNAETPSAVPPGRPHPLTRRWRQGDRVALHFESALRAVPGANEATGRVSLYHGPLLLAFDPRFNPFDEDHLPAVDWERLGKARPVPVPPPDALEPSPWLLVDVPTHEGGTLRLVDFASAGASGTRYRSWLPAHDPPPAPAQTRIPRDAARIRPGLARFQWRPHRRDPTVRYRLEFATNSLFSPVVDATEPLAGAETRFDTGRLSTTAVATGPVYWRVVSLRASSVTHPEGPPAWFQLDPNAPEDVSPPASPRGPNGELIAHGLRDDAAPEFGRAEAATFLRRGPEGTTLNGHDQRLVYPLPAWPDDAFTVRVRVRIDALPEGRLGQVFSAWTAAMDDPLRLVVDRGRLFARVEAGGAYGTPGAVVTPDRWLALAAVRKEGRLTLWIDGKSAGSVDGPEYLTSQSTACALGGNPRYSGNEFLAATFADFALFDRALTDAEIVAWSAQPAP